MTPPPDATDTPETDRLMNGDWLPFIKFVRQNERELAALRDWKAEALEMDASWDVQAIGKALGLLLGSDIRKGILPAIETLKARLEKVEGVLKIAHSSLVDGDVIAAEVHLQDAIRNQKQS